MLSLKSNPYAYREKEDQRSTIIKALKIPKTGSIKHEYFKSEAGSRSSN